MNTTYDVSRMTKLIVSTPASSYEKFLILHNTTLITNFQAIFLSTLDDMVKDPDVSYSRLFEGSAISIQVSSIDEIGESRDVKIVMEAPLHTLTWEDGIIHVKSCWSTYSEPLATDTELLKWSYKINGGVK